MDDFTLITEEHPPQASGDASPTAQAPDARSVFGELTESADAEAWHDLQAVAEETTATTTLEDIAPSPPHEAGVQEVGAAQLIVEAEASLPIRGSSWLRIGHEVVAAVQTLFSAAVYATLIVTFGFQVARVDGLSMAPTLEDHDRLIVNKLVYMLGDPRPGDIVMLYYPLNPDKMFVKRVIAREGDSVRIVDGQVYVNDVPLKDDYIPLEFRSHDDWGPQVIPEGYYFVMGDHRNNSSDSRQWGMVPKKYIVGKVKLRWWPLQDARIF
jgi:signal peptidase I